MATLEPFFDRVSPEEVTFIGFIEPVLLAS